MNVVNIFSVDLENSLTNNNFLYKIILFLLFVISCKNEKAVEHLEDSINHIHLKQMFEKSLSQDPDSALVTHSTIRKIAADEGLNTFLFISFLKTAVIYSVQKDNYQKGKLYIDSAKIYYQGGNYERAQLNLHQAIFNQTNIKAVEYYLLALKDSMYLNKKDLAKIYINLSALHTAKQNYNLANEYAQTAVKRYFEQISTANLAMLYNNLYIINIGLHDTLTANTNLMIAKKINDNDLKNNNILIVQNTLNYCIDNNQKDSALKYLKVYKDKIVEQFDDTYLFYPYVYEAEYYLNSKNIDVAQKALLQSTQYIHPDSVEDAAIQKKFYEIQYEIYLAKQKFESALFALNRCLHFDSILNNEPLNEQIIAFEKQKKDIDFEVKKIQHEKKVLKQKIISALLGSLLLIAFIISWLVIKNINQKRKIDLLHFKEEQQQIQIENTQALLSLQKSERSRISQELHDSIGSNITSIILSGEMLNHENNVEKQSKFIQILKTNIYELKDKLNDIVWLLNARNEVLDELLVHLVRWAKDFLEPKNIIFQYINTIRNEQYILNDEQRRILFYSLKEIINNSVKYSNANLISMFIYRDDENYIQIDIQDNGKGFDQDKIMQGNGIQNITRNFARMNGAATWTNNRGTKVNLKFKI